MGLIRPADFARMCGKDNAYISVNVSRNKIVTESGMIDTDHPVNKSFMEKCLKRGKKKSEKEKIMIQDKTENDPVVEYKEKETQGDLFSEDNILDVTESTRRAKHYEWLKRQKETEKLEIEIAKKNGELVPTELVTILLAQFSKSVINAFQNAADNLLVSVGHKKKLTREETADLKAELVSIINQANDEAVDDSKRGLKNIIDEYSDKRGRGEKK